MNKCTQDLEIRENTGGLYKSQYSGHDITWHFVGQQAFSVIYFTPAWIKSSFKQRKA